MTWLHSQHRLFHGWHCLKVSYFCEDIQRLIFTLLIIQVVVNKYRNKWVSFVFPSCRYPSFTSYLHLSILLQIQVLGPTTCQRKREEDSTWSHNIILLLYLCDQGAVPSSMVFHFDLFEMRCVLHLRYVVLLI